MRATAWLRSHDVEIGWALFALANWAAMVAWPDWETVPFHFVWISLTLVYGFRVWGQAATAVVLTIVVSATGVSIGADAFRGIQLWGELFEVPLMSAMFVAMVWHARRRQVAMQAQQSLLARTERFLHDASHELKTPITIARGNLELLLRATPRAQELHIAIDELQRMDRILERLLMLARADQPDFVVRGSVRLDVFLEDVFMRWAEVAPRSWRLGDLAAGTVRADAHALRSVLDALLENAVKYTERGESIELRSREEAEGVVVIEVADGGCGVPPEAAGRIFERFARVDAARTRATGGVGLGLAIVDAIAKAHGGRCSVRSDGEGATFTLRLPGFRGEAEPAQAPLPSPQLA
ncbi:MAG TPA: HAMP domain-containing sensor histidine kinase [Gaiellaceae bacterium]|jgi:signal transduction histidine kinase|nr:HAMP domain-containing sensor histidine kinase [Gaiellaceae bacterium]